MDQAILSLTPRELEVVSLVASGHHNQEIGRTLWIEERTVADHLASIYRKLGLGGRAELIVVALCRGVGDRGRPSFGLKF